MKNKIILLMLLSIITAFAYQESYEVLAHFEEIDVIFDECVPFDYNVETDTDNEYTIVYEIDLEEIDDTNLARFNIDRNLTNTRTTYEDLGYTCK